MSYFGKFNERFTLVDVDGLVLASAGDELSIKEPENFGNVTIKNKMSRKWRSFNAEFTDAESLNIVFDRVKYDALTQSPYDFLNLVFTAGGSDSDIRLRAYRTPKNGSEIYKEWGLVFSSFDEQDYGISFRAKKIDFQDKLRTRFDESINVESSENLDGVADTPLTLQEIQLHSRRISLTDRLNMGEGSSLTGSGAYLYPRVDFATEQAKIFNWMGMPNIQINESEGWQNVSGYSDIEPFEDLENTSFKFNDVLFDYDINIRHAFQLTVFFQDDFERDYTWKLKYSVNKETPVEMATGTGFADASFTRLIDKQGFLNAYRIQVDIDPSAPNPAQPINANITGRGEGELSVDIYLEIDFGSALCDAYQIRYIKSPAIFPFQGLDNYFNVDLITQTTANLVQGAFIYDVLNKAIQKAIGDESYNPLRSNLLSNGGCAELNFITTGNKIRELDKDLIVKIKDILDFVRVRYNARMSIVTDGGLTYVDVNSASQSFADIQILHIGTIEEGIRRKVNNELSFNAIELGYEKYSNPNKAGLNDGFNTIRGYLLPVKATKSKLELTADVYTDGAEIERIKRLRINAQESDQSDEDIFVIKCQKFDDVNNIDPDDFETTSMSIDLDSDAETLTINGIIITGIVAGDKITLNSGGSPIVYVISNIQQDYLLNRTIITTSDNIPSSGTVYPPFYFTDSSDVGKELIFPERTEAFNNITGVTDKDFEYNIDHAPSNILIQWFDYIGGNLRAKSASEKVKVTSVRNNVNLSKEYQYSSCSKTTDLIVENQDFELSDLRSYNSPIFTDAIYELTCYLDYDSEFKILQDSLFGQNGSTDYGYITFNYDGQLVKAHPVALDYKKKDLECKITCWERAS